MLSDFGTACPATGFALGIERILLALERQGLQKPRIEKDLYVAYESGKIKEAIAQVNELRVQGKVAELALQAQSKEEAVRYQQDKGYSRLIYLA